MKKGIDILKNIRTKSKNCLTARLQENSMWRKNAAMDLQSGNLTDAARQQKIADLNACKWENQQILIELGRRNTEARKLYRQRKASVNTKCAGSKVVSINDFRNPDGTRQADIIPRHIFIGDIAVGS